MTKRLLLLPALVVAAWSLIFLTPVKAQTPEAPLDCTQATSLYCPVSTPNELSTMLGNFPTPRVKRPTGKIVTYDVSTRGTITADLAQFKQQVAETLADSRGWARMDVQFDEVSSGGQFTVVLAAASQVPTFGYPCDSDYSCQSGRYVIINQDRWLGATKPWNDNGGDLRGYRHMVVNHETGHWLGHPHASCPGAGQPAAVMQQQSINLAGCKFNPWPLSSELWSTKLGITL